MNISKRHTLLGVGACILTLTRSIFLLHEKLPTNARNFPRTSAPISVLCRLRCCSTSLPL